MCMNELGGIIIYYILIRVIECMQLLNDRGFLKPNLLQLVL